MPSGCHGGLIWADPWGSFATAGPIGITLLVLCAPPGSHLNAFGLLTAAPRAPPGRLCSPPAGAGSDVRWIRLCSRPPEARRWALGFCRGSWVGSGVHSLLFFPSALRLASDRFWATLGACSPRVTCKRPRYVMLAAPAGVPSWLLDILSWPWSTLCRVWAGLGVLFAAAELTWVRLVFCAPPWVALGGGPWSFEQLPGDLLAHRGGCSARCRGLCIHQLGSQALGARVL